MKKPEYEQLKLKTKKVYSKIGRVHSPALNGEYVAFTNKGFTHMMRKGRNPRPRSEQVTRFVLIPYAEQIIKNPKAMLLYRTSETKYYINRHGQKILTTSTGDFLKCLSSTLMSIETDVSQAKIIYHMNQFLSNLRGLSLRAKPRQGRAKRGNLFHPVIPDLTRNLYKYFYGSRIKYGMTFVVSLILTTFSVIPCLTRNLYRWIPAFARMTIPLFLILYSLFFILPSKALAATVTWDGGGFKVQQTITRIIYN